MRNLNTARQSCLRHSLTPFCGNESPQPCSEYTLISAFLKPFRNQDAEVRLVRIPPRIFRTWTLGCLGPGTEQSCRGLENLQDFAWLRVIASKVLPRGWRRAKLSRARGTAPAGRGSRLRRPAVARRNWDCTNGQGSSPSRRLTLTSVLGGANGRSPWLKSGTRTPFCQAPGNSRRKSRRTEMVGT